MFPTVDITNALPPDTAQRKHSRPILPQYHTAGYYSNRLDGVPGIALTPSRCSPYIILGEDWRSRWAEFKIDFRIFYCRYCQWLPIVILLTICANLVYTTTFVHRVKSNPHQLHPIATNITSNTTALANYTHAFPVGGRHPSASNSTYQLREVTGSLSEAQLASSSSRGAMSLHLRLFRCLRTVYSYAHFFVVHCRSRLHQVSRISFHKAARPSRLVPERKVSISRRDT